MGFWSVFAVGVGGIVGGIFPVLGLSVQLTHGGAPLAFAIAGVIVLITTYAYAKLSLAYPCQGGTVAFLNQAFGKGLVSGSLNLLLWLSYVVMLSLYFSAFGSYGASLFPKSAQFFWQHLLISAVIVAITGLNLRTADLIGKTQSWIVGFKLLILLLFIALGIWGIDVKRLEPVSWSELPQLVSGGMIIFLSYEGFELIANTAEDVVNPEKTLPRAYYWAVVFVILLYVLVAIVTVGILPVEQIVAARDYALAAAARPFMGQFGVVLVTIAALLSTTSAINATLYGSTRFCSIIAQSRSKPQVVKKVVKKQHLGLFMTSGLTLVIANLFDVTRISTMGSAGFLLIFTAVNLANAKLYQQTQSCRWVSFLGAFFCVAALVVLWNQTARTDAQTLWVMVFMVGLAFSLDVVYCLFTSSKLRL
ncbi:MAG: APC family permease [Chroococcidiopsidaceae cyanobacterium CP_BM_ER_R8_30]|nr:APC family permease [Chroococcidiopsidaceae cyanobacterium CP_BM_ER_R8_30]